MDRARDTVWYSFFQKGGILCVFWPSERTETERKTRPGRKELPGAELQEKKWGYCGCNSPTACYAKQALWNCNAYLLAAHHSAY